MADTKEIKKNNWKADLALKTLNEDLKVSVKIPGFIAFWIAYLKSCLFK